MSDNDTINDIVISDYSNVSNDFFDKLSIESVGTNSYNVFVNEKNRANCYFNIRAKVDSVSGKCVYTHCPNTKDFKSFLSQFQERIMSLVSNTINANNTANAVTLDIVPMLTIKGDKTIMKLQCDPNSTYIFNSYDKTIDFKIEDLPKMLNGCEILAVINCSLIRLVETVIVMQLSVYQMKIKKIVNCLIVDNDNHKISKKTKERNSKVNKPINSKEVVEDVEEDNDEESSDINNVDDDEDDETYSSHFI
jgi:hypothetical protein